MSHMLRLLGQFLHRVAVSLHCASDPCSEDLLSLRCHAWLQDSLEHQAIGGEIHEHGQHGLVSGFQYIVQYNYSIITVYITYGPHKAVAEVSNHNEPIGRKSGIQLVRKIRNQWTSHSVVLF